MNIEVTKPTPDQAKLQALFNQTEKETIALLLKENDDLYAKLKAWEACADRLFVWADEVRCGTTNQALYEAVKEDIIKYNRLKLNEPDA